MAEQNTETFYGLWVLENMDKVLLVFKSEEDLKQFISLIAAYQHSGPRNGYNAYWISGEAKITRFSGNPITKGSPEGLAPINAEYIHNMVHIVVENVIEEGLPVPRIFVHVLTHEWITSFGITGLPDEIPDSWERFQRTHLRPVPATA